VLEYRVTEAYGQNGGRAVGFVLQGKWWRYSPSEYDIAFLSIQDELFLRDQLNKTISPLHSMTEPDPVSEKLYISNMPETMDNIQYNIRILQLGFLPTGKYATISS
jgi:hypothetical protein